MRAIAFFIVALDHYLGVPWGFGGVNFFFVLSGFLITGILFDTRDQPGTARSFYLRRTLRIFPLYYGVFLALLVSSLFFHWQWSWPWLAWPLYLGNFLRLWAGHTTTGPSLNITFAWLHSSAHPATLYLGHFWSLCVEEQFYLIWPWLVFGIRSRRKLMTLCIAAVIVCPITRALVDGYAPPWIQQREFTYIVGVPFQLDALLLGAILAFLWRSEYREHLQRWAWVVLLGCTLATGYLLVTHGFFVHYTSRRLYRYPPGRLSWGLSFLDVFGAALLVCALSPGTLLYAFLSHRVLRAIGRISYGAYVFHDIFHDAYSRLAVRIVRHLPALDSHLQVLTFVLAMPATFLLAALSFRFFETPFLNLKDRWAPSKASSSVSPG